MNPFNVKVNQIFKDLDRRSCGFRFVQVIAIVGDKALVRSRRYAPDTKPLPPWNKRTTEIRLDRFKISPTGYQLVTEPRHLC